MSKFGDHGRPILRSEMPVTKYNRTMCCVYGVVDPTGKSRDMVCGIKTPRRWNKDDECWEHEPWCAKHKEKVKQESMEE